MIDPTMLKGYSGCALISPDDRYIGPRDLCSYWIYLGLLNDIKVMY